MLTDEEKIQVDELLYDFIIVRDNDGNVFFYNKALFEKQPIWSTYDKYGQQLGHEYAGDNHPCNLYSELGAMWSEFVDENSANEDWDYDAELKKFVDENAGEIVLLSCIANTYHDGRNWQTRILQSDNPNISCSFAEVLCGDEAEKYATIVVIAENDSNFTRCQGVLLTSIIVSGVEYNINKESQWIGTQETYCIQETEL